MRVYWDRRRLLGPRAPLTGTAGVPPAPSAQREKPHAALNLRSTAQVNAENDPNIKNKRREMTIDKSVKKAFRG